VGLKDCRDHSRYNRNVRQERETQIMTDMTYDPGADAIYIYLGTGEIDRQEEAGPFIYDVDTEGRIVGIEILSATKVLAPGDWQNARRPNATGVDVAE
jgi:uncharacterized protein YuzE